MVSVPREDSLPDAVNPLALDTGVPSLGLVSVATGAVEEGDPAVGLIELRSAEEAVGFTDLVVPPVLLERAIGSAIQTTPMTITTNPTGPDTIILPGPWNIGLKLSVSAR